MDPPPPSELGTPHPSSAGTYSFYGPPSSDGHPSDASVPPLPDVVAAPTSTSADYSTDYDPLFPVAAAAPSTESVTI